MGPQSNRPRLERFWRRGPSLATAPLWLPLAGAAAGFRSGLAVRNLWWRFMARQAPVTTISVGNLTVGGNAKTPFTLWLARRLARRGLAVGIASRGYRRRRGGARAVLIAEHGELKVGLDEAGDEPAMMARSFDGPIAVAKRRIDAIKLLAERAPLDVVILDDGFQHRALKRDADLVLVNRERGFGNGWMLPAGPMRDPVGALARADAIILVSTGGARPSALSAAEMSKLERRTLLNARLRPRALVASDRGVWRESSPALTGRRVIALSGLADPAGFYAMLHELEADLVGVLEYPDHHAYTSSDWQAIAAAARDADLVVTTEKDLIKLERFPFARDSLYALRIEVAMAEEEARVLDDLIAAKLRSPKINVPAAARIEEVSRDAR
ncbi:MAG TPA: tetraacyldisaccharide 4'-kinase [Candidatus Binataceae bacterium]|nr:tetraacyldisaccharide 4'-kinase [Candidatus Binataceae bacterium]